MAQWSFYGRTGTLETLDNWFTDRLGSFAAFRVVGV